MKLKNLAISAFACIGMAFSLAACGTSGPGEHDHTWDAGTVTTEATCHSEGVRTFKCTVPGCEQTKTENITMTPHNYDAGKVTKEPTCKETGIKTYTCQNAGCGATKTETLAKVDHNYVPGDLVKVPDLYSRGEREFVCTVCGDKTREEVDPRADFGEQFGVYDNNWSVNYSTGDTPLEIVQKAQHLERVDNSYKHEQFEVTKNTINLSNNVALIAFYPGANSHKLSLDLHISFVGNEDATRVEGYFATYAFLTGLSDPIPLHKDAKSWSYTSEEALEIADGSIIILYFKNAGTGAPAGTFNITLEAECPHVWNEGVVVKDPTEEAAGIKEYTCVKCGEKYQEEIEPLPPDPYKDCLTFLEGKTAITRFDDGGGTIDLKANSWVTDDGHTVHAEVTKASTNPLDIWRAGVQINTGIALKKGNDYEVSFEVSTIKPLQGEEAFELFLTPEQWSGVDERLAFRKSPIGPTTIKVNANIKADTDSLWISVQMGTIENEVVITKVKVVDKGEYDPFAEGYLDFTDKIEARFDDNDGRAPLKGFVEVANDGHSALVNVTEVNPGKADKWAGGMFIHPGMNIVPGEYTISFNSGRKEDTEAGYNLVLQVNQWQNVKYIAGMYNLRDGDVSLNFTVTEQNAGDLWLYVECGDVVNEVTITDLVITPKDTEHAGLINMSGKIIGRFDPDGSNPAPQGSVCTNDLGYGAYVEVTKPAAAIWQGGMFIETGVELLAGKEYEVSFDVVRDDDTKDYEILFSNKQWGGAEIAKLYTPNGEVKQTIQIVDSNKGYLWLYIQLGNTENGVELSNLKVRETGEDPTPDAFNFDGKVEGFFDEGQGVKGGAWTTNFGHDAHVKVEAAHEIWEGGMFVNTGVALEANKRYNVSFSIDYDPSSENQDKYEVILQSLKGERVAELAKLYTPTNDPVTGLVTVPVDITGTKDGNLRILVQFGDKVQELVLSKLVVTQTGEEDTDPTRYNFEGKVSPRQDDPTPKVNVWLSDFDHVANVQVTDADAEAWKGGMFIETGVDLVEGYSYTVKFDVAREADKFFKVKILNSQFDGELAAYEGTDAATGVTKEFDITSGNIGSGKLWLFVETGDQLNTISITNLSIESDVTPVDPHPERFNFTDKVIGRFEDGVKGNTWLTDFNHVAHIKVSEAHATTDYYGGAFINTGIALLAEKTYTVSFTTTRENETPFTLVLQNKQWNETILKSLNTPLGETEIEIQTSHLSAGDLWIFINFGTTVNEVTISDLKVTEKGASTPYATGFLDFTNRVAGRFEGPAGNAWVDENTNTKAHMEVTRARTGKIWEGKMYINTGVTLVEGKNYSVSYKINRTEDHDYEVLLQNGKDGKWIATYKKVDEVGGVVNKETGAISADQAGTLWVTLQSGDQTNNFEFYDLIVNEVNAAEPGSAIVLTDKIEAYFLGANGSVAVAEDGTNASVNITNAGREAWRGGMFIDTGLNLEAGDYTLSFDSLRDNKWEGYTLILQRNQWEDVKEYAKVFNLRDGSLSIDFTVTSENAGYLWLYVERGSEYNKVTLSNLKVTPKDTTHNGQLNLTGKARERFGDGVVGTLGFKDGGYSIDVDIDTRQADKRWAGGTIIHLDDLTGITEAKTYTLSFETSTTERSGTFDFKIGNAEYGAQYANVTIPYGSASIDFVVSVDSPLWLSIECGDVEGKFTLSNLKLTEKGGAHANLINLTGKVLDRFESGVVGTLHLTDGGYGATIDIDTAGEKWAGGTLICVPNVEVGRYTLKYDSAFKDGKTGPYNVLVGETKYHSEYGGKWDIGTDGEQTIWFYAYSAGDLWLAIECGNTTGELAISNIRLVKDSDYMGLDGKVEKRNDNSTVSVTDITKMTINVTTAGNIWDAGGFINLGYYPKGTYEFSIKSNTTVEGKKFRFYIGEAWYDRDLNGAENLENGTHTLQYYLPADGNVYVRIECGTELGSLDLFDVKLSKLSEYINLSTKTVKKRDVGTFTVDLNNSYKAIADLNNPESACAKHAAGGFITLGAFRRGVYELVFDAYKADDEARTFNLYVGTAEYDAAIFERGDLQFGNDLRFWFEIEDWTTLIVRLECGGTTNNSEFSNFRVERVEEYKVLYEKTAGYFYEGSAGTATLPDLDKGCALKVHIETKAEKQWQAGATIDLGSFDAGTYKVSFKSAVSDGKVYTLLVGNSGNEKAYDTGSLYNENRNGRLETGEFTLDAAETHLILKIQCGETTGDVTVSNIRIIKVA